MLKKQIILFIACALTTIVVKAQQFNFRPLGVQPPAECYQVLQDHKGYLWFSTDKGLYKYNGNTLKHFSVGNGLPDNAIFKLYEDSRGHLLFTSLPGIIGYISNDSIVIPKFNKQLSEFLNHGRESIFDLFEDSSHILWVSTNRGFYKTVKPFDYSEIFRVPRLCDSCRADILILDDKKALVAFNHPIKHKTLNHYVITSISINRNNTINTFQFFTKEEERSAPFAKTLLLPNGTLLLSLYTHLIIIQPDGHYTTKTFDEQILFLYQDKTGGVWVGFHKLGVAYYENTLLNTTPYWSLQGYSVSSINEDNEKGIWVSTLEKGIFYTPSKAIIDYSNCPELNKKISAVKVITNKVFVNDYSNSLYSINSSVVNSFDLPKENKPEGVHDFLSLSNTIYYATTTCLLKSDTSLRDWRELKFDKKGFKSLVIVYNMCVSPEHWVYAINMGNLMAIEGDSVHVLDTLPARGRCMCITQQGEIFIGCINGLYKYENQKFIYMGKQNKVLSSKINMLKEDSSGNLWVLTMTSGTALYKNGKILSTISMGNGLPSNNCSDIAFDQNEVAWLGTDNGLCKISPKNNSLVEVFNTHDGLISEEITTLALNNNELWIGTGNGLCMMNTTLAQKNTIPPPVYITSLYVNDSIVPLIETHFSYRSNNFRFKLNGLTFKGDKCNFKYRLLGLDTDWHTTNFFEISYNNLMPGNYQFQAKAINNDGILSTTGTSFSFVIEKPFWKRLWFIMLEIISGVLLIYSFVRYRLNIIHRKEEENIRVNKMLAEYQLTALRTQMNPHFIFNAINSIQHYILENKAELAYGYLTKFAHLIRMMLNNAQEKTLSLQQELEMLTVYVELEKLRFSNGFEFTFIVDEKIDPTDVYIPAMLIQPYVENAIWHGLMNLKGKRNGQLTISVSADEKTLTINIEDNGIGRKMAQELEKRFAHKSIGMELNRKRIELLSSLPENEKAAVTVIDLYDENKEPCGTKILISLAY